MKVGKKSLVVSSIKGIPAVSYSEWDFSTIPEGKVKHLATYAFKAKSSLIQRMSIQKKLALLVAFVYEYEKIATDELLTALIKYYESIFRRAKIKNQRAFTNVKRFGSCSIYSI